MANSKLTLLEELYGVCEGSEHIEFRWMLHTEEPQQSITVVKYRSYCAIWWFRHSSMEVELLSNTLSKLRRKLVA